MSVVLGTSGVVFGALAAFAADAEARVHVFCHAVPGTWHAMGVMLSAAGSLQWLRDAIARRRVVRRAPREAAAWPPGCEGLLFAPYLAGERTPHADPDARGAFVGLSLRHDRGALVRAVLEGVAYGLRDSLELLRALGVRAARRPHLGRRRAQHALARDRRVGARPPARDGTAVEEGAAYGAALLAGCATGTFGGSRARRRSVRARRRGRTDPRPSSVSAYAEGYERFRRLYPALRTL